MVSVSVCMIDKNKVAVLTRCLDCLTGIADDTGSTDPRFPVRRGKGRAAAGRFGQPV